MAVNRGPRNALLLAQIPETNPFKATAQAFFGIGNALDRDIEAIAQDGRLSAAGKAEKSKARRQEALGKLAELQKPIDDYHQESERMRAGMKWPVYDRADTVAAQNRQRYLDRFVGLSFGQKSALMSGPRRSVGLIDAVLEFKDDPWMAGINIDNPNEREAFEMMKQERQRELNGPLMDALEARGNTEAEIMMIVNLASNDVRGDDTHQAEIQAQREAYVAAATA
jgi:hypothetical protein